MLRRKSNSLINGQLVPDVQSTERENDAVMSQKKKKKKGKRIS